MSPGHTHDPGEGFAVRKVLARVGDKWTGRLVRRSKRHGRDPHHGTEASLEPPQPVGASVGDVQPIADFLARAPQL